MSISCCRRTRFRVRRFSNEISVIWIHHQLVSLQGCRRDVLCQLASPHHQRPADPRRGPRPLRALQHPQSRPLLRRLRDRRAGRLHRGGADLRGFRQRHPPQADPGDCRAHAGGRPPAPPRPQPRRNQPSRACNSPSSMPRSSASPRPAISASRSSGRAPTIFRSAGAERTACWQPTARRGVGAVLRDRSRPCGPILRKDPARRAASWPDSARDS
jgi:hypothetical protein